MKPTIPDTGTVIRLDSEHAVIRMRHEGSCRKCGAAAIGLCKGGLMQELTVKNSMRARVNDTVRIGLVQGVQYRGFLLAYTVPAVALVFGIAVGHFLGEYAGFPPLEIIAGFVSMIVASFFSLRRLKLLGAANPIEIVNILSGPPVPSLKADEETIPDHFRAYFQPPAGLETAVQSAESEIGLPDADRPSHVFR